MILSLLRLILYIFQTANSLLFGTSVCVCFIIGIIISSPSFTLANLGNFFIWISLCLSKKLKKTNIWLSSASSFYEVCEYFCCYLWNFSLEQAKSWLVTFASLKLARPFLMKPPKSILYLCRIVAHNGLKTKQTKNSDWNTNFTPKLFKIEIIYCTIFPFLSQHTLWYLVVAPSVQMFKVHFCLKVIKLGIITFFLKRRLYWNFWIVIKVKWIITWCPKI